MSQRGHIVKPNGPKRTWAVMYRDGDGHLRWEGKFNSRTDAQRRLTSVLAEIDKGTFTRPSSLNFEQFSKEGILQTDGYQVYDGVGGPKLVHVGCWAHARRKFVDAVKVNRDDAAAVQMVLRTDALFVVDRAARKEQMTVEERLALRRQHAEEWAEEIHRGCRKLMPRVLPKSALSKAVGFTLTTGRSYGGFSTMRRWSCRTTWRRTRCGRLLWAARTG